MSSFFTLPASQRKRKRDDRGAAPASKKRGVDADGGSGAKSKSRTRERDESISGSDIDEDVESVELELSEEESGSESEQGETAAERRLKLAERYLENVREEVDDYGFDAAEIDRDLIAERLKEDVDEFKGRAYRQIASDLAFATATPTFFRADTQSTTSIAVHPPYVYTVSKDKTLIKWELATPSQSSAAPSAATDGRPPRPQRKKPKQVKFARGLRKVAETGEEHGHTKAVLSVAVSPSGKFVATGGEDRKLIIWDAATLTPMKTFTQHRDAVSGLAFVRHISTMNSGEQLFTGSYDRTIKTWSLSSAGHAYVETLFGHQDNVSSVAAMTIDQCISVGARDRTARLWKVAEESQLVFRGGSQKHAYQDNTIDCVAPLPPSHFVTGSDSGALSLWSIHKKKPLHTIQCAHGLDPLPPLDELSSEVDPQLAGTNTRFMRQMPRWITALATVPGTDVVLSGSWDGFIRAWKISEDKKTILPLGPIGVGKLGSAAPDTPSRQLKQTLEFDADGMSVDEPQKDQSKDAASEEVEPLVKGVINDIAVFERRAETKKPGQIPSESKSKSSEPEPRGLCIVAAVGKEHRFGRWKCFTSNFHQGSAPDGRNGAVVFEVPFISDSKQ
ncbi:rRNA processing protein RRP9 [Aspergillus clavatus NRRL 1]|uniref:Small nucleolar ribonucleoprotein complex subunit, putative n=1 Tax=Aspergillus clavatus (strain ATCC 1007 / CBS 513.65 / DSM 816 / NCTC 3887 / NRRL 1 / QM 1276 / 107) TaxID=344612 RepID=A1CH60_ASPCL|nr:rRNA processing protein RRP9 [Aspergillus clavatus NRRL 1]EAW10215.1 small nucleolar ribonucleoprotein complex subunit, putative [Aspergillus clavatus NRRL 1]